MINFGGRFPKPPKINAEDFIFLNILNFILMMKHLILFFALVIGAWTQAGAFSVDNASKFQSEMANMVDLTKDYYKTTKSEADFINGILGKKQIAVGKQLFAKVYSYHRKGLSKSQILKLSEKSLMGSMKVSIEKNKSRYSGDRLVNVVVTGDADGSDIQGLDKDTLRKISETLRKLADIIDIWA